MVSYPKNPSKRNTQRDHDINQQPSSAVRPPIPRDATAHMTRWEPGNLPKGGYRSTFDFSGTAEYDTKHSPTSGGGCKVC
jgi:hypothetical protein